MAVVRVKELSEGAAAAAAAVSIVLNVNAAAVARRGRAAAALVIAQGCVLLQSEFMVVQLFSLAAVARCVAMATTETTAITGRWERSWLRRYLSSLNDTPLHQQRVDRSVRRNVIGATLTSKFDYPVRDNK